MPAPLQNLSHDPIRMEFPLFKLHEAIRCNLTNYNGKSHEIVAHFETRNCPRPLRPRAFLLNPASSVHLDTIKALWLKLIWLYPGCAEHLSLS